MPLHAVAIEIAVILALVLANGLFALSEFALVSAKRVRLEKRAREGDRRSRRVLELLANPGDFLSMVQVGITLVGVLAGAFAGATIATELARGIRDLPWIGAYADPVSLGVVVVGITYLSIVVGELAPKRIALAHAEAIARGIAPAMRLLSMIARPVIWFLSVSTDALLKVFGVRTPAEPPVTQDEIRLLMREGARSGTVDPSEHAMVESIFRLGDRPVGAVLTPRADVVWIDVGDPPEVIRSKVESSRRSRFPVCRGSLDDVVGVVSAKDLLVRALAGGPLDLRSLAQPAHFVPEETPALKVLDRLRATAPHLAIVVDEHGGVQGVVTVNRIVEAIIGEIATGGVPADPPIARREDGSWSVDGMHGVEDLASLLEVPDIHEGKRHVYHTAAGFVLARLGRIPAIGDRFEWGEYTFEVADMDERRVDRILITRKARPEAEG